MGNLGVTLEFAVDVQIECRVNAFKIEVIPFACLLSQIERAAIMPAGIFVRQVREHDREGITGVQILDVVIPVHLYTGRNRDRFIQFFVDLKILHMSMLFDLPYAVERHKPGTGGTVLNPVLDPDGVRFSKGNIVTAVRFCTDAFKAFVFFHFLVLVLIHCRKPYQHRLQSYFLPEEAGHLPVLLSVWKSGTG